MEAMMKRQPAWVPGLLLMGAGLVLFLTQHWTPANKKQVLSMLPMVPLEHLGIFAMGFGLLACVIGLVRTVASRPDAHR